MPPCKIQFVKMGFWVTRYLQGKCLLLPHKYPIKEGFLCIKVRIVFLSTPKINCQVLETWQKTKRPQNHKSKQKKKKWTSLFHTGCSIWKICITEKKVQQTYVWDIDCTFFNHICQLILCNFLQNLPNHKWYHISKDTFRILFLQNPEKSRKKAPFALCFWLDSREMANIFFLMYKHPNGGSLSSSSA